MNITKQRLEQLIKEEYTEFLNDLSYEDLQEALDINENDFFDDLLNYEKSTGGGYAKGPKKLSKSWRSAIKRDAGLGTMTPIKTIGDLARHGQALDRSEREQVVAGADPKDIGMPRMKRKAALRARARAERRQAQQQQQVAGYTDADSQMSVPQALMQEDGHEDVPSAFRAMKAIIEDAEEMMEKLESTSGNLPTWWTNKMAVAVNSLNKMRDYLLFDSEDEEK